MRIRRTEMRHGATVPETDRVGVGEHPGTMPLHLNHPLPQLEIRAGDCRSTVEDQPDGPDDEQQSRLCWISGTCDGVPNASWWLGVVLVCVGVNGLCCRRGGGDVEVKFSDCVRVRGKFYVFELRDCLF